MSEKMLAACGLNCDTCIAYIATRNNDCSKLVETAKLWSSPNVEYKPEDIPCDGCHSDRLHAFCNRCPVRLCAKSGGFQNCGDCQQYPCVKLDGLWKTLKSVPSGVPKANLDAYRKSVGVP